MYQELDQPDSSLYYYTKAKLLLDQTNDWAELSTLYGVMGELYHRALHKDKEAAEYTDLCEKYARLAKDTSELAFLFMKRGNLAVYFQDYKKAEGYYLTAKKYYSSISQLEEKCML